MSEFDFLLAGISHYLEVRFGPAERHTLNYITLAVFSSLFFPEANLEAHLSILVSA